MSKVLCYLYDTMADFEISFLMHRIHNSGKRETVGVAGSMEKKLAQSGLSYQPDALISDFTDLSDVDALIIPGGPVNNDLNEINDLARRMIEAGKLVGAICFGPQFLGRAGILDDHIYTTSCSEKSLKESGTADPYPRQNFVMKRVVRDRNLITAQGYAFVDFAEAVCDYFEIYPDVYEKERMIGRVKSDFAGEWEDEEKRTVVENLIPLIDVNASAGELTAYVDGSFDSAAMKYGYGVVLLGSGDEITLNGCGEDPVLASMHNVAGEIKGAETAMRYALEHGVKNLTIYHDYEGIAAWCTGRWKTNKEGTKAYKAFYDEICAKVEVHFVKVTGHSGDHYNDMADSLARNALGL